MGGTAMPTLRCVSTRAVLALFVAFHISDATGDVDQRVGALEQKMDAMMGLLEKALLKPGEVGGAQASPGAPAPATPNLPPSPPPKCENAHDEADCENWAANGECTNNPGFMHSSCAKSCQVCGAAPGAEETVPEAGEGPAAAKEAEARAAAEAKAAEDARVAAQAK